MLDRLSIALTVIIASKAHIVKLYISLFCKLEFIDGQCSGLPQTVQWKVDLHICMRAKQCLSESNTLCTGAERKARFFLSAPIYHHNGSVHFSLVRKQGQNRIRGFNPYGAMRISKVIDCCAGNVNSTCVSNHWQWSSSGACMLRMGAGNRRVSCCA